jgi:hypothetical protein
MDEFVALSVAHEQRLAALVEICLGQCERLLDLQPGAPEDDDQAPCAVAMGPTPAWRMTAMLSSTPRRVGRVAMFFRGLGSQTRAKRRSRRRSCTRSP